MCSFYSSEFAAMAEANVRQARAQQLRADATASDLREMAARQAPPNCEGCGAALVRVRCDYCGRVG